MPHITTDSKTFPLRENETLLEALERTGHEIEYQCRSGYCGSCRVKLRSGSVSYDEMPMAFLMPDDILPCCCRVKEDIAIAVKMRYTKQNTELPLFNDDP
ncbi:MAG: class I ribonucleotide reductase maintenance protein YfaE [Alysiella sp.]|uniref:class I ribonucleotide reductase maintenance protein YfaE n=1 Tax=Alysiella sp. TaxID=1872483 RepID=UPI0026DD05A7|nr:class I ribonucleotide reductase maintenance protein YfaE [Alysiella sp.]MDO4433921.1 class I ribonucleotide reductase maintenance protein YfaE [Alysiella sp.]